MAHNDVVTLTNQHLNDRFSSPFALLSVAIRHAHDSMGRDVGTPNPGDILNPAYQILRRIGQSTETDLDDGCDE